MTNAARLAELHSAENLLSCYYREIARPAGDAQLVTNDHTHELRMRLADRRQELRVLLTRPSLGGGLSCEAMPWLVALDGGGSVRMLRATDLGQIIVADLAARTGVEPHPELITLIADSRRVLEYILAAPSSEQVGALAAEQWLVFGHPFHPSPKARIGFEDADLARYSPELGARFRLHLVAARPELVVGDSIGARSFDSYLENALGAALPPLDGRVAIPVHPFQARLLRQVPEYRALLDREDLVDLGPFGPSVCATSSIRTVQRPGADFALKTSLDVRVTNCIRRNAVHEMRSALQVARWMREASTRLRSIAPRFEALEEPAFVSLLPRPELPHLGVIARDVSKTHASPPSAEPMVAAALFGDRHLGRARLQRRMAASKRARFFRGYLDALVVPMLHLFFVEGLMFEPHLQNVLVSGFDGSPPRVFLRDFDNCKVVDGISAPERLQGVRPEVAAELRYPRGAAWDRFVYCLFVNNLAEVMIALADGDAKMERTLAREAAGSIAAFRDRSDDPETRRMLDALLSAKTLPAKANLLTRAFKHKDRDAPFVAVPNPLREAGDARGTHPSPSAGV